MFKQLVILVSVLALSPLSWAGEANGKVTRVYVHNKNDGQGVVMFHVENHVNAPEACPGAEWAVDLSTPLGEGMYSMLLLAGSTGKSVRVMGAGDCGDFPDRERPVWIMLDF